MLLGDHVFRVSGHRSKGDTVSVTVVPEGGDDEAVLRLLSEREEMPYAFKEDGGQVKVKEKERVSKADHDEWALLLEKSDTRQNAMYDVNYNGVSIEDQAQLRARWLLLADPVRSGDKFADDRIKSDGGKGIKPVLPLVWAHQNGEDGWTEIARLLAVYQLVALRVVDVVRRLVLTPEGSTAIRVDFEGDPAGCYSQKPKGTVKVKGVCQLDDE